METTTRPPAAVRSLRDSALHGQLQGCWSLGSFVAIVEEAIANSLDAHAKRVTIEVRWSTWTVSVLDDGDGISPAALAHVGQRNWTTKQEQKSAGGSLSSHHKGQALANLASLSVLRMESVQSLSSERLEVVWKGHVRTYLGPCRRKSFPHHGTRVTAHNVFWNVPVRRCGLNKAKELAAIVHRVRLFALANPGVSFSVEDQDTRHTVASIPVVGVSSLARYSQVLGSLGETHEFADMSCTKPRFHGIVCLHAHRKFVLVLLNSRPVVSEDLLVPFTKFLAHVAGPRRSRREGHASMLVHFHLPPAEFCFSKSVEGSTAAVFRDSTVLVRDLMGVLHGLDISGPVRKKRKLRSVRPGTPSSTSFGALRKTQRTASLSRLQLAQLTVLSQVDEKFIICRCDGVIACVDQHAAHERVRLEQLERATLVPSTCCPTLRVGSKTLNPAPRWKVSAEEATRVRAMAPVFKHWHFVVEVDSASVGGLEARAPEPRVACRGAPAAGLLDCSHDVTLMLKQVPVVEGIPLSLVDFRVFIQAIEKANTARHRESARAMPTVVPAAVHRILANKVRDVVEMYVAQVPHIGWARTGMSRGRHVW